MDKKYKMTAGFIVISICLAIGGATLKNKKEEVVFADEKTVKEQTFEENKEEIVLGSVSITPAPSFENAPSVTATPRKEEMIVVHVCGNVNDPGVFCLPQGSRIYEAIELSGGLTEEADDSVINLADRCIDGMQIFVPAKSDELQKEKENYLTPPSNAGGYATESLGSGDGSSGGAVNINTAGVDELMTLKGIGRSRAEDIIAYREQNGSFGSVEEIMNIRGIKEGMFSKIKDDITVR
ncbi:MAG: helix-hairpin-helix domain-containing protein [Lachnospiraceae bacterium]|nr:helix-hairpin-helix domain-containing protein [Lachnospiraceae bacterium]